MKDTWVKKGLVVSVILLFIGVAVAPSINFNVVKAYNDNDLVEVTTQACGINGFGNTTVKLTRQQHQSLEQYLVEFRARLNKTTTREEVVPIFKDAIVELDKYGLLPKGMSVEQAQKLVTRQFHNQKCLDIVWKLLRGNQRSLSYNDNWCCLLISYSNCLVIHNILYRIVEQEQEDIFTDWMFNLGLRICLIQPIFFWCHIGFHDRYNSSRNGWVFTAGLNDIVRWNGHLDGGILHYNGEHNQYNETVGAIGFTGINILLKSYNFILGTAFHAKFITSIYQY
jgi:hypothetical protein